MTVSLTSGQGPQREKFIISEHFTEISLASIWRSIYQIRKTLEDKITLDGGSYLKPNQIGINQCQRNKNSELNER
jgi:hypothetical protein